jgi:hypothetical protein
MLDDNGTSDSNTGEKKSVSRGTGGGEAVETHVQHVTRRHCVLPAL